MNEPKPQRRSGGLTAGMGAAVVYWQVNDISSATAATSTALLALQYFLLVCGLGCAIGGSILWMKGGRGAVTKGSAPDLQVGGDSVPRGRETPPSAAPPA